MASLIARNDPQIGQELHDGLGQRLTGLEMASHRLAALLGREGSRHRAEASLLNEALRNTPYLARRAAELAQEHERLRRLLDE